MKRITAPRSPRCRRSPTFALATLMLSSTFAADKASADPCGMVPPMSFVRPGQPPPIRRVGPQKTYVFYKDGVEAIALRPGFEGDIDNFGMLIPFPSVPGIRKIPDTTFAHLAAAIDPPEVLVDLSPPRKHRYTSKSARAAPSAEAEGLEMKRDEVRVLKEEAVGMYEVAVLAAGSAGALKRWMDNHGFTYPTGMDDVTEEYVASGWVFVAVKTRVGPKSDVNPRPGMTSTRSLLPPGGFTGHVQAMGFRFKVDKPVVPMRLSAFNEGQLRNIVYFVGPEAIRIDGIDTQLVRRQLPGKKVRGNVTEPLPVRVLGGSWEDLVSLRRLDWLTPQRDPARHNGVAKTLFASDLQAVTAGNLNNPFEEREKALLNISERLGLRHPGMDALHEQAIDEERKKALGDSLAGLDDMAVTVIDGDFRREWIAANNLTFSAFKMSEKDNHRLAYNAVALGPKPEQGGMRYVRDGELDTGASPAELPSKTMPPEETPWWKFWED
jgi:hypothetical protein